MIYLYNEILFNHTNEVTDKCYDIDELWKQYAKLNKPDTKNKYVMIPFIWGTLE